VGARHYLLLPGIVLLFQDANLSFCLNSEQILMLAAPDHFVSHLAELSGMQGKRCILSLQRFTLSRCNEKNSCRRTDNLGFS
jgi:hypothetical protein